MTFDERGVHRFLTVDRREEALRPGESRRPHTQCAQPRRRRAIAAQQADLVAQVIANRAGATLGDPPPLRPVLRGLLITGGQPKYLLAQLGGGRGDTATSSNEPLWSPGSKVAARYLGPYLARAPHQTAENPRKPR